jgi:NitT/TauT family transport system ATP-binding protein
VVFQRYSVFPHLNVLDNVAIGLELPQSPLLGRLFGAENARRGNGRTDAEKVGLGTRWINIRRSSPAGCSSGWRLPRRSLCSRACCCLMNPSARWIPAFAKICTPAAAAVGETRMTVFMVTHDLAEGFNLGTRLLVFDKVRIDPQAPNAYGARITYDIPLNERGCPQLTGSAQITFTH